MIKLDGNKLKLEASRKIRPKQLRRLNELTPAKRGEYMQSLLGLKHEKLVGVKSYSERRAESRESQYGIDKKITAEGGRVIVEHKKRLRNDDSIFHRPLHRLAGSYWIGVEIECLVKGEHNDDNCSCCEGNGEITCHNCDGSGRVEVEDSNGYNYRNDCACCDGSGNETCPDCEGSSSGSRESVHDEIRDALRAAGVTNCTVKCDGSLSSDDSDYTGVEITVLFDTKHGFGKLQKVCDVLNKKFDVKVNKTCGLHVHLDQYRKNSDAILNIGNRFGLFLPALAQLVPESRRKNNYCKVKVSNLDDDRYAAINLTSYNKHSTIEIRLHSGSTDFEKIRNWVQLLMAINSARAVESMQLNVADMCSILGLSSELTGYFLARAAKFNPAGSNADESNGHDDIIEPENIGEATVILNPEPITINF